MKMVVYPVAQNSITLCCGTERWWRHLWHSCGCWSRYNDERPGTL